MSRTACCLWLFLASAFAENLTEAHRGPWYGDGSKPIIYIYMYILYIHTIIFGYIKTYQKTIIFGRRSLHSPFWIGYHPAIRVLLPFGPLGPGLFSEPNLRWGHHDLHWGWCLLQSISRRHRTQESCPGRETRTGWFLPVGSLLPGYEWSVENGWKWFKSWLSGSSQCLK